MKDQLAALQGTWDIVSLVVEGQSMPPSAFAGSSITVKGSTFTTASMGAVYGGTISVDAGKSPKQLDLKFKSGPEKGNTAFAIYDVDGDTFKLCLTVSGTNRPTVFAAKRGSGHAFEVLKRRTGKSAQEQLRDAIAELSGEWSCLAVVRDGQELPAEFVKTGTRLVKGNETTVLFGKQVFLRSAFTLGPSADPKTIDTIVTEGDGFGQSQLGIYKLDGDTVTYCLAPAGRPRPQDFAVAAGVGGTLTVWKRKKAAKKK